MQVHFLNRKALCWPILWLSGLLLQSCLPLPHTGPEPWRSAGWPLQSPAPLPTQALVMTLCVRCSSEKAGPCQSLEALEAPQKPSHCHSPSAHGDCSWGRSPEEPFPYCATENYCSSCFPKESGVPRVWEPGALWGASRQFTVYQLIHSSD